jgi:hypothetical protein
MSNRMNTSSVTVPSLATSKNHANGSHRETSV